MKCFSSRHTCCIYHWISRLISDGDIVNESLVVIHGLQVKPKQEYDKASDQRWSNDVVMSLFPTVRTAVQDISHIASMRKLFNVRGT